MSAETQATVLVVEDDSGVLRLQQLRLERAGYAVKIATTAAEAMTQVRAGSIDLMLLDQNLPGGVNGLEFYQQVKEAGFDVPAILVTGFGGEGIVLESLRAGLYDFVPKTTDYLNYLLPTIERVLKKRRIESQLVESEARLASIIRTALDAIVTVSEQQKIGLFNPAAEQLFGLPHKDAVGQSIERFLPSWSSRLANGGLKPGEQIERWETEAAQADGTTFPAELSVSWVEANRRRFWTCVVRDVRERMQTQEERERLIREQAARMEAEAARAKIVAVADENDRLNKELRLTDRMKNEFLAVLAHELRNPLAPIRNALHQLRLGPEQPAEARVSWEVIDRQVSHLTRLVDDLLDVNRISQGKIQLQREWLDLRTVVQRALEASQPILEAHRHMVRVTLPPAPLPVDADPARMVQVLANLLNNAAKYTPDEGRIDVIAERGEGEAVVRVRDTGVGIPAEMLPHLFDMFMQSQRTLGQAEGGLGIGLTLVRRLAEMQGGSVEAWSAGPGKGSEFVVRLPLTASPPPSPQAIAPEAVVLSRRVLVVDDNKDSASTLTRLLRMMGHDAHQAHDGPEALKLAEQFRPEVLLLDIGLPGMDGYEVARRLRADGRFAGVVLAALTGNGSPDDRRMSREAGFHAHLVKPVDLNALNQILADPQGVAEGERQLSLPIPLG